MIHMTLKDCRPRTDWLLLGLASLMMVAGTLLTLTWVGAIVGAPMFVAALQLLAAPKTTRDRACV